MRALVASLSESAIMSRNASAPGKLVTDGSNDNGPHPPTRASGRDTGRSKGSPDARYASRIGTLIVLAAETTRSASLSKRNPSPERTATDTWPGDVAMMSDKRVATAEASMTGSIGHVRMVA